jgi:2-polyprenyl-3-methyl-5-hydroxy-6-metoxy-1,4-benzoquinol methylase
MRAARPHILDVFDRTIRDRFEAIAPHVAQGDVLDVGCVDARPARRDAQQSIHKPNLLFRRLVEADGRVTGVDIDAPGVEALRAQGFDVVCADAQTMDLGRQFDAIVAGEVIEHVENPGMLLRNLRRHLKSGGRLIISTPNPFFAAQTWKIWRHGEPQCHEGHVAWYDPLTLLALMERCGLQAVEGYWIAPRRGWLKAWKRFFRPYFGHSFLVVAQQAP